MLGRRVGHQRRERAEVVARDPSRSLGVQHVAPVPQAKHGVLSGRVQPHPQHGVGPERVAPAERVELRLGPRPGQTRLATQLLDRESRHAPAAPAAARGRVPAAPATNRARPTAGRAAARRRGPARTGSPHRARRSGRPAPWRARPAAPSRAGGPRCPAVPRGRSARRPGSAPHARPCPVAGSVVHRGTAVLPPAANTRRQYAASMRFHCFPPSTVENGGATGHRQERRAEGRDTGSGGHRSPWPGFRPTGSRPVPRSPSSGTSRARAARRAFTVHAVVHERAHPERAPGSRSRCGRT